MARTGGGEVFEKRPEGDERRHGHLRGLHECEPSTALTRGHPLGADGRVPSGESEKKIRSRVRATTF
jgi:hypothetical protein